MYARRIGLGSSSLIVVVAVVAVALAAWLIRRIDQQARKDR